MANYRHCVYSFLNESTQKDQKDAGRSELCLAKLRLRDFEASDQSRDSGYYFNCSFRTPYTRNPGTFNVTREPD